MKGKMQKLKTIYLLFTHKKWKMLAFVPQILVANPKFDKKSETVGENFSLNVSAENIVMSGSQ